MASSAPAAASFVHVAFNHPDATHFVVATASMFYVFLCDPELKYVYACRPTASSGEGSEMTAAEMLTWSELVVVARKPNAVDGSAHYDAIIICNLHRKLPAGGVTTKSPCEEARGVRLLGDYMLVAGEEKTMLCRLSVNRDHYRREKEVTTGPNRLGLCAMARPVDGQATLVHALPRPEPGAVQIRCRNKSGSVDVHAHASALACLALSPDGRLLATASSRGTLVRIFNTTTGKKLQELRRGSDKANIHCIVFSPDSKWLAISSDKGTVHVFSVNVDLATSSPDHDTGGHDLLQSPAPAAKANQQAGSSSTFSFLKGYLPGYFSSKWSLAQLRGLREGTRHEVAFGQHPNTVLVVGMDGSFRRCQFDPVQGGEMLLLEQRSFMDACQAMKDQARQLTSWKSRS